MRKIIIVFFIFISAGFHVMAMSPYEVNDAAIEKEFESSITSPLFNEMPTLERVGEFNTTNGEFVNDEKDAVAAWVLCTFFGYLGFHRAYLGTESTTIVGYILTLGGCGVVYLGDWVVLLVGTLRGDIKKYVANPDFFMW